MVRWVFVTSLMGALALVSEAKGEVVERVAAVVGEDLILLSEVQDAEAEVRQPDMGAEDLKILREEVVERLIGMKLMEQAMNRANIQVSEADLQRNLAFIQKRNGMTEAQLRAAVEAQGFTWDQFIKDQREDLRSQTFIRSEVMSRVDISDADLRSAYVRKTADAPADPQVHLFMALLRDEPDAPGGRQSTLARAAQLRAEVAGGKPFAEVARASSVLPNAAAGGDSGWVRLADLNPDFRSAVDALPSEGGLTPPLDSPQGVWLLAVTERRSSGVGTFEEMKNDIADELYRERQEKALQQWVEQARRESHVEIHLPSAAKGGEGQKVPVESGARP